METLQYGASVDQGVETAPFLNPLSLQRLFGGFTSVLRVPEFCDQEALDRLRVFAESKKTELEPYTLVTGENGEFRREDWGVKRFGVPFSSTTKTPDDKAALEAYYADAVPSIHRLRGVCYPFLSPLDRLRLELDEMWRPGGKIAVFENAKMSAGILRWSDEDRSEAGERPHTDNVNGLFPQIAPLKGQFSGNIYLHVPREGGELSVWPVGYPGPEIRVAPAAGDLILFSTRTPHGVRRFTGGPRSSIQCFIGLTNDDELVFWN